MSVLKNSHLIVTFLNSILSLRSNNPDYIIRHLPARADAATLLASSVIFFAIWQRESRIIANPRESSGILGNMDFDRKRLACRWLAWKKGEEVQREIIRVSLRRGRHGNGLHGTTCGSSPVNFDPSICRPRANKNAFSISAASFRREISGRLFLIPSRSLRGKISRSPRVQFFYQLFRSAEK